MRSRWLRHKRHVEDSSLAISQGHTIGFAEPARLDIGRYDVQRVRRKRLRVQRLINGQAFAICDRDDRTAVADPSDAKIAAIHRDCMRPWAPRAGSAGVGFVEPMMPKLVQKPPEGDEWTHEIKYDGYRTQIVIAGDRARAFTRRGNDWTAKYGPVIGAALRLGRDCHIEGEIIVQDATGRPDFNVLRGEIEVGSSDRLILYAFDLLSVDGRDLRSAPCEERRAALSSLLGEPMPADRIHYSQEHSGSGAEFLAAVEKLDLEGIVSKKRNSRYRSGYTGDWQKTKTFVEREYVVVGYDATPGGARSLLVATWDGGVLRYAGRAMVTIRGPKREALWECLEEHRTGRPPLPDLARKATEWFEPRVSIRVRHLRGEETLRHATLVGLAGLT